MKFLGFPRGCKKFLGLNKPYASRSITIGIRKEEKNSWESRAPLTPTHIHELISRFGINFIVQPSNTRVFSDNEYSMEGARVDEDLTKADVIIGIKEIPTAKIIPKKAHICFSHTHKGQEHNLDMLRGYINKGSSLVDYELLTDDKGRRLVAFGKFAGYAGMINCLHGLGLQFLKRGFRTPLLNVSLAHQYPSLDSIRLIFREVGQSIAKQGFPSNLHPILIVFTGTGNVSKGAQEIFKELPHIFIKPDEVELLFKNPSSHDKNKIYATVVEASDYCIRKDGSPFDHSSYIASPDQYKSLFNTKFAPFASAIVNGIYWEEEYPRLLTIEELDNLLETPNNRLLAIADISCDIHGSIEATTKATTFEEPFLYYSRRGRDIHIMSIDNLPAQLPKDASEHFGDSLTPIIASLSKSGFEDPLVQRGVIVKDGCLQPVHAWLSSVVARPQKKRILIMGSGYVSGPVAEYLGRNNDYELMIGSNNKLEAEEISKFSEQGAEVHQVDISDPNQLQQLVKASSLVISLVPANLHLDIAKACLGHEKHLVTASYISPAMQSLSQQASEKRLVFLNEIGLDPGLDHLSAKKIIDEQQSAGNKIVSFSSWCGGLPAPECADNPLGYKFSWSPRGVLLAALNDARYLKGGDEVKITGDMLLSSVFKTPCISRLNLEGIPNRDSLKYLPRYGLEGIRDMLRGTLRYSGFSSLMRDFVKMGLLSLNPLRASPSSYRNWKQVTEKLLTNFKPPDSTMEALEWLGMLSETEEFLPRPTLLDSFCELLQKKLCYSQGERDMVVMQHQFAIENSTGQRVKLFSDLLEYGQPGGFSAMARTVGYPAAMAADLILQGVTSDMYGVLAPTEKRVYEPMLKKLEEVNIVFKERKVSIY